MRKDFVRTFDDFFLSQEDIEMITSMCHDHDISKQLEYHGYLNLRRIFRSEFGKNLTELADKLGLKVAKVNAFTARPGTVTSNHIDGNVEEGPLVWRLAFYVGGEPGIISWYQQPIINATDFCKHSGAFIFPITSEPLHQEILSMSSAFVRTEYPHVLDVSKNTQPRITISATFVSKISWQELNGRLNALCL